MAYLPLEDYGLIGVPGHIALVSRLGSIDWLCLPQIDSPSHFGAILDENQGGRFQIAPQGEFRSEQDYLQRTHVLQTIFETPHGRAVLTDWMTPNSEPLIIRRIDMIHGRINWQLQCSPRFDYGKDPGEAEKFRGGILFRGHGAEDLGLLRSTLPIGISSNKTSATERFTLEGGQSAVFSWCRGLRSPISDENLRLVRADQAAEYWRSQAHRCITSGCSVAGPWHDVVIRSDLLLKLLIQPETGAIAESATTSIPGVVPSEEEIRNASSRTWDYRFGWLRDSAWAIQAMANMGRKDECRALFSWISDLLRRDRAEGLQSVYRVDGGKLPIEHELEHLSGYQGARPVRIGNLASSNFQLDLYGHMMLAVSEHHRHFAELPEEFWPSLSEIADFVCQAWRRPDHGFWETRAKPEHFVASKLFCWVALDRAISLAGLLRQHVPARWKTERDILHKTICQQGFDSSTGTFVRSFGETGLDSAALLMPIVGFLPIEDPRIMGTITAIETRLCDGILLRRFEGDDGIFGRDANYLPSSLWFVDCLALAGRGEEASDRLAELCTYATPLGALGDQAQALSGETTGNLPSAASHIALINASLYVGAARGRHIPAGHLMGWPETPLPHIRVA